MYATPPEPLIHIFDFPSAVFDTGIVLYSAGKCCLQQNENAELTLPDFKGFILAAALSGKLTVASDDATEELEAPYAILLHRQSDNPCVIRTESECMCIFIMFGGSVAENIVGQFPQNVFMPFPIYPEAGLLHGLNAIVTDVRMIGDIHQGASRVYALLGELCHYLEHSAAVKSNKLVEQATRLIHERYAYLYGVEDLAESMGVSKHHLIREFMHHTGTTPGQFLSKTRVENAKLLLAGTDYSVELIGQLVGYANGNYFCKAFKRQIGISPKDYRKRNLTAKPLVMPSHILDTEP